MTDEYLSAIKKVSNAWRRTDAYGTVAQLIDDLVEEVSALRAQQEQENPKPLTLEEIKREKYVWLEPLKEWAKVTKYGLLYFGTEDYTSWRECGDLGQLWNAYRHKTKEGDGI